MSPPFVVTQGPPGLARPGEPAGRRRFVPATLVGFRVKETLGEEVAGRVIAAVSGAIYIELDRGPLLWLAAPGGVPHGRALLAPLPPDPDLAGAPVSAVAGEVLVGDLIRIGVAGAPVWRPPVWAERMVTSPEQLMATLGAVARRQLDGGTPARPALPALPQDAGAAAGFWTAQLAARASLPEWIVHDALRPVFGGAGFRERLDELAEAGLGLGPGLTPSGDDFIGGLLFSLHVAGTCDASLVAVARACGERVSQLAPARTTPVSAALLVDYSRGEGPEPLHRLACNVLGGNVIECDRACDDLAAIGAATGRATLAGFVAGLVMALGRRPIARHGH